MDWLISNHASIHCSEGSITFSNKMENINLIHRKNEKPTTRLVKASNLLRGVRKVLQIYVVKLNKVEDPKLSAELEWLSKFSDIFPEELTNLPPSREVDHEIKVITGSSPVSRRPYKMFLVGIKAICLVRPPTYISYSFIHKE